MARSQNPVAVDEKIVEEQTEGINSYEGRDKRFQFFRDAQQSEYPWSDEEASENEGQSDGCGGDER